MNEGSSAENDRSCFRSIRCNDAAALAAAEEAGETVEVEHVCGDPLRHIAFEVAADEAIDRDVWEEAVANDEPWTRPIPPAWDDDPNHPEGVDCHGEPLSSGERCGRSEHRVFSPGVQHE